MPDRWFLLKADLDAPDAVLRALRAEPPVDGPPEAGALAQALSASLGATVEVPALGWTRGTFHWVARGRLVDGREIATRVLRLDRPPLREGLRVGAEVAGLVRAAGHPAPEPLAVIAPMVHDSLPVAVSAWLHGTPLAQLDHAEPLVARSLGELGAALAGLHQVRGEGAGGVGPRGGPDRPLAGRHASWRAFLACRLDAHLARCQDLGALDGHEAAAAARFLADGEWSDAGPVDRLLHGDPGPANLVVDAAGRLVGLLDWEDAMVGDPVFELASCASFQPERRWPSLFEGYLGRSSLPGGVAGRFWRYFLRLALARTVARARFGLGDFPGRPPAATRIQRALAALSQGVA